MTGTNTLEVEVTNIDRHGIWIYINGKEFLMTYKDYPWFKEAKIKDILDVKLLNKTHLYWPELDIDLDVKTVESPGKYPLKYK